MKLVDKLISFSRFLRHNKDHELDLDTLLTTQTQMTFPTNGYFNHGKVYEGLNLSLMGFY